MCYTGMPASVLPDLPDAELLTMVVDRLLTTPSASLPAAVALDRTGVLLRQTERLRAAGLDAVRDVDHRQLYQLDGAGNAGVWVGRQVGGRLAPVTLARRLDARPVVSQALAQGRLDVLAAERVCLALDKLPDATGEFSVGEDAVSWLLAGEVPGRSQEIGGGVDPNPVETAAVLGQALLATAAVLAIRLEPVFVLLATRTPAQVLVRCLQSLVDALLPEEHLERWQEQQAETYLDVRELLDGYGDIKGVLDPETFAMLRGALHRRRLDRKAGQTLTAGQRKALAFRQVLRDADSQAQIDQDESHDDADDAAADATADDELDVADQLAPEGELATDAGDTAGAGDGAAPVGVGDAADPLDANDTVDPGRADAAGSGDAAGEDVAPVSPAAAEGVGVQLTVVTRQPGPLAGGTPVPLLAGVDTILGRPGALPGRYGPGLATSLPVDAVRRLGCGGHLAAILLDAHGTPVGASGTHRHATERERRALLTQWGGTCATDGCTRPGVIPHHAEPWWLTHRTQLKDLVPYCDGCHHDLHEGGKTIKLRNGRWIGPTGWAAPPDDSHPG